jgi:hypothetical protein
MTDCRTDPALEVVAAATAALAALFSPTSQCPAEVGTTDAIRFFAGDGAPLAAWDSHATQGCDEPFVWVRAMRRYRSRDFPGPTIGMNPCGLTKVIAVELGVGWCAVVDQEPRWADYAREAAVSMDCAWRIEEALCNASQRLTRDHSERQTGTDTITPYGPEGGVIAWTGVLYASYS